MTESNILTTGPLRSIYVRDGDIGWVQKGHPFLDQPVHSFAKTNDNRVAWLAEDGSVIGVAGDSSHPITVMLFDAPEASDTAAP